jgi:uncharacterized protein YqjF (DUF2071 family)
MRRQNKASEQTKPQESIFVMPEIIDAYRPYPAPTAPFVMHQEWHDLLFLHWRVDAEFLRRAIPTALPLDTFDGEAYIGIVPFMMKKVRPRFLPAVPRLSFFPELNVRTYVALDNRPGVYFFSLDAGNPIAVAIARASFHLPYFNATMDCIVDDTTVHYASTRTDARSAPAYFRAAYRPAGDAFVAAKNSLEYFLTARYGLYTTDARGNILRAEIHHPPWTLQRAECEIETNTMTEPIGIPLRGAPHLLFAKKMEMVNWLPQAVRSFNCAIGR